MTRYLFAIWTLWFLLSSNIGYADQMKGECEGYSARITWYGELRGDLAEEIPETEQETAAGVSWEMKNLERVDQTDRVELKDGAILNVQYEISGLPAEQEVEGFYRVTIFPAGGMTDPNGKVFREHKRELDVKVDIGVFAGEMGWIFDEDEYAYEMVAGLWKFQLWRSNCLLLEKTITTYKSEPLVEMEIPLEKPPVADSGQAPESIGSGKAFITP